MSAVLTRAAPAFVAGLLRYLPIVLLLLLWQMANSFHLVSTAVLPPVPCMPKARLA